jgi:hypothetical protein
MAKMIGPGTMPRPGVLWTEPGNHSLKTARIATLTSRGLSPKMAELLAPFVWGGPVNG